ncbi:hypothetical protein [Streptomyces sp. NPDC091217]
MGERVGREWLGSMASTEHGGPLIPWMGSVIRRRRGAGRPAEYADKP